MRTHLGCLAIGLACATLCAGQGESIGDLMRAVEAKPDDPALLRKLIRVLNERIDQVPGDRELRYDVGLAHFRARDYAESLQNLEKIQPADPETQNLKGDVYEHLGRPLEAVHAFQHAAEAAPENEDYRFDYILELLRHEAYPAAALIAARATKDFPHSQRILLAYTTAVFLNGDFGSSAVEAAKAQQMDPESELALYLLVLSNEGQHSIAPATVARVRRFLEKHRNNYLAYYLEGRLDFGAKDYHRAVQNITRAAELNPEHTDSWLLLGRSYEALGDRSEALNSYRRATKADDKRGDAWYRVATLARILGQKEEAKVAFAKFRAERSQDSERNEVVRFLYVLNR